MKFLGNMIWFIFGGLFLGIGWFIAGLILCITVILIPLGIQCFKISGLVIWPFGKNVNIGQFGVAGFIGNILWLILFGWELSLCHLITGLIFCITIIGIPFGKQHFKYAKLALIPFGATITHE